ncbi:MAG TPA: HEAT repeat domain-containing protein [Fimbriimonadaceae bacterium]|nr:HEAT repeat domain-containing protein [Fimbriimonadaceae bacterium]
MLKRLLLTCLLAVSASQGWTQYTSAERKGLDDLIVLGNLSKESLRPAIPTLPSGIQARITEDPILVLGEILSWRLDASLDIVKQLASLTEGQPLTGIDPIDPAVPEPLRVPLGRLLAALGHANDEVRASSTALTPDQRRDLIESLPRVGLNDPSVELEFARRPLLSGKALSDLTAKVDTKRILRAGLDLQKAVEAAVSEMRSIRLDMPILRFLHRGMPVIIAGVGTDIHADRDAMLVVDLGGNDRYEGRIGAGIGYASVCIDLGGDDTYSLGDANLGCGLLGVGIAIDVDGDDTYRCNDLSLGSGVSGFGSFVDRKGNDHYQMASGGLGFGSGEGLGIMRDLEGTDDYRTDGASLGASSANGIGWMADIAGSDTYRSQRFSQGSSFGGIGAQVDLAGDDLYQCQEQGQAFGAGGFGLLINVTGSDHYLGVTAVQSVAAEGGVSCLIDHVGDDTFHAQTAESLAHANENSLSMVCDRSGNDSYTNRGGRPARARSGGVAIFLDSLGDDHYGAPAGSDLGGIAAFADLGGADEYRRDLSDATTSITTGSIRFDSTGSRASPPTEDATRMTQTPPTSEIARAFDHALAGGSKGQVAATFLRRVGQPAFDWALANRLDGSEQASALIAFIGSPNAVTAATALANAGRPGALYLCIGLNADPSSKAILDSLKVEPTRLEAIHAAGHFKCREATTSLLPLAASPRTVEAIAAARALSNLDQPETFSTAEALLLSRDAKMRQVAISWCAKQPGEAVQTAERLSKAADELSVRVAIELLAKVGSSEALKLVTPFLEDRRPGVKIQALSALDGRVPESAQGLVARLANDTNPLVRSVAKRVRMTGG